ncbi:hypothetical protein PMPD1_3147 [Paramixta manurensis]|uniref:Uncharacterized protein n=1 Tax=Paramixta manurensis TaxID=2740817 RepID=A0A6M8UI52_9GAMM|nr:hypothetical protein PMPD1_3147 [Erwiniaceae bacterium PD-1]
MCDIADEAAQLEEHNIRVALANIKKPEPRATECQFCGDDELMPGSNYCSPECCRKHELRQRRMM